MVFTTSEARTYYAARVPSLKINSQKRWRGPCPVHQGDGQNFSVDSENGLSTCHSQCGRGWDMISLEQELTGLDFIRAKERVYQLVGRPQVPWEERNVSAIYDYTDSHGGLVYQVLRYVGKEFKQRRPDGRGGWVWGLGDVPRLPYRLPKIADAQFVFLAEGEKDVLTLEGLGLTASCNSGGAGNFKPELADYFAGKDIGLLPDNDDPGREHAQKVAQILSSVANSIRIIELPGLPVKGDVSDWVAAGGTLDELRKLYAKSQLWTPGFEFSLSVPDENDQFIRSMKQEIEIKGGITEFWNLTRLSGLETPWKKLSHSLGGGLRPGEVYVLGANQGAGKTSLALKFIISAMRRCEGCLLFSMEMGWGAVFQRMASSEARVDLNEFRGHQFTLKRGDATPEERLDARSKLEPMLSLLAKATAELADYPLWVSTKSAITTEYIARETARMAKQTPIRVVVIDHMQLMSSSGNERGDYEKFTAISREMKKMAMEINTPVLLVSQTSRSQAKERRGELQVSDLRGTGAIEEDAAAVMLLYEDPEDKELALTEGDGSRYTRGPIKSILKLGKNRYGEQERCFELQHFKSCTRFELDGA